MPVACMESIGVNRIVAEDVAMSYRDGKGTDKDLNNALEYFEKSQVIRDSVGYGAVPYSLEDEINDVKKQLAPSDKALA